MLSQLSYSPLDPTKVVDGTERGKWFVEPLGMEHKEILMHRDILVQAIHDCSHDEMRVALHAMLEAGDAGRIRHHKDGSRCWSLTCERAHHLIQGQLQIPPELQDIYGEGAVGSSVVAERMDSDEEYVAHKLQGLCDTTISSKDVVVTTSNDKESLVRMLQELHEVKVYSDIEWAGPLGRFASHLEEAGFTHVDFDHEGLCVWMHRELLLDLTVYGPTADLRAGNHWIATVASPGGLETVLLALPGRVKDQIHAIRQRFLLLSAQVS